MGLSGAAPAVLTVEQRLAIAEQVLDEALRGRLHETPAYVYAKLREGVSQALAAAEQRGLDLGRADAGNWNELLQCARWVIAADENKTPGVSRQEAMRVALRNLIAAVGKFPHPCAAAVPPRSETK